jgi:hypothetical protein
MLKSHYGEHLNIEVVAGGFILSYPVIVNAGGEESVQQAREVFVSPRKLIQKIKNVIGEIGLVADDTSTDK